MAAATFCADSISTVFVSEQSLARPICMHLAVVQNCLRGIHVQMQPSQRVKAAFATRLDGLQMLYGRISTAWAGLQPLQPTISASFASVQIVHGCISSSFVGLHFVQPTRCAVLGAFHILQEPI